MTPHPLKASSRQQLQRQMEDGYQNRTVRGVLRGYRKQWEPEAADSCSHVPLAVEVVFALSHTDATQIAHCPATTFVFGKKFG